MVNYINIPVPANPLEFLSITIVSSFLYHGATRTLSWLSSIMPSDVRKRASIPSISATPATSHSSQVDWATLPRPKVTVYEPVTMVPTSIPSDGTTPRVFRALSDIESWDYYKWTICHSPKPSGLWETMSAAESLYFYTIFVQFLVVSGLSYRCVTYGLADICRVAPFVDYHPASSYVWLASNRSIVCTGGEQ